MKCLVFVECEKWNRTALKMFPPVQDTGSSMFLKIFTGMSEGDIEIIIVRITYETKSVIFFNPIFDLSLGEAARPC